VHTAVCAIWFVAIYLAVQRFSIFAFFYYNKNLSGLDVVALLQRLHLPESWVKKVRDMPKAAGSLAAALVLYKVFFIFIIGKKDKNVNFLNPIIFPDIHTSSLCLFDFGDSIGLQLA
jgi:hypothetical protein